VKSILDFQKIEDSLNHLTTQKPLLKQGIDLIITELRTNFNLINEKLENSIVESFITFEDDLNLIFKDEPISGVF
jgi:hypothetical protein